MAWLIRLGAYAVSGLAIWQFFNDGPGLTGVLPVYKHLALDAQHGMIFGVCAGFSNYIGIDVTLIRLALALSCFYRGIGIGLYLLAFLIMPTA
jgi:phage shock protein PspC (stress-responsive transcriptional regulator)